MHLSLSLTLSLTLLLLFTLLLSLSLSHSLSLSIILTLPISVSLILSLPLILSLSLFLCKIFYLDCESVGTVPARRQGNCAVMLMNVWHDEDLGCVQLRDCSSDRYYAVLCVYRTCAHQLCDLDSEGNKCLFLSLLHPLSFTA